MKNGIVTNEFEERMLRVIEGYEKNIVYVDGEDIRTVQSMELFRKYNNSNVIFLGDKKTINDNLKKAGIGNIKNLEIINPVQSEYFDDYKQKLMEIFKKKNKIITEQQAHEMASCPNYFAALMLRLKQADCGISGSLSSTGSMLKPLIQVIGTTDKHKYLSGAVLLVVPDCPYGLKGQFIFTDVAVMPDPNEDQMLDLVINSHGTASSLFDEEPKIAILSYSTKGSARSKKIEQIERVVETVKRIRPDIKIDGELQFDAAIIPEVAQTKCPESDVAGKANVLIFPELGSANICVKAVQRLAKADYYGTVIQGSPIPFNDLSRGCPAEEIAILSLLTLKQLKFREKKQGMI